MVLYSDKDYADAKRAITVRIVIAALILAAVAVLLALFVTGWRKVTLAMLASGLGGALFYFYFATQLMPWVRYGLYQRDIRRGRAHDMDCRFVSISGGERMSDGVAFHEMVIRLDGAKNADNERLLFWDADKTLPPIEKEQPLHIRAFGNYIIALDVK